MENIIKSQKAAELLCVKNPVKLPELEKDKYLSVEILVKDSDGKLIKSETSSIVWPTCNPQHCFRMFSGLSEAMRLLDYYFWMGTF